MYFYQFLELNGEVAIEKTCVTEMQCQTGEINCEHGCHTVISPETHLKNTTCICHTNLCNGSSILSVNYAIIGTLVLFYFLK